MNNGKQETPVQKITEILNESGAKIYVVAVATPDGDNRMRALSRMYGSADGIIELLASVIRGLIDEMEFPDKRAKHEVTAEILSRLMAATVAGANREVQSIDPL